MATMVVTVPTALFAKITASWTFDASIQTLLQSLQDGKMTKKRYTWSNGKLLRKNKSVIGKDEELRKELMAHFHGSSVGGHSSVKMTVHIMSSMLYWKGMGKDIKKFIHECIHCQRNKPDLAAYPRLLQPLPIPNTIWESISIDFIEALPRSQGYTVIFMVVDRLTKYAHFMPLSHPFTAAQVAQEFLDTVYKLRGLPTSIVSDKDKVFLIYGQPPPVHVPYLGGLSKVDAVDRTLEAREQAIQMLKFYLSRSQNRMKQQADKKRSDRVLKVRDWVFLKLQPHRQVSIRQGKQNKFSPKCFGLFQTLERIGQVAYMLKLPNYSQIHNVFHVSQLKPCKGNPQLAQVVELPSCNQEGLLEPEPIALWDRRVVKKNNVVVVYGLVQWSEGTKKDSTWEPFQELYAKFPSFAAHS
ncbi:retrotransposable element Tf2 [Tanacetum coccineum]|uniref:Retrotransposable element Tf2 n=1 Tax=Tanacetum coccineum TaxID=301880 RepID=A0ABQ4X7G9_9ASTR